MLVGQVVLAHPPICGRCTLPHSPPLSLEIALVLVYTDIYKWRRCACGSVDRLEGFSGACFKGGRGYCSWKRGFGQGQAGLLALAGRKRLTFTTSDARSILASNIFVVNCSRLLFCIRVVRIGMPGGRARGGSLKQLSFFFFCLTDTHGLAREAAGGRGGTSRG